MVNLNNIDELEKFLAFIHTHYEKNDSWILSKDNYGTNWSGPYVNCVKKANHLSPFKIEPDLVRKKRNSVDEILKMYKKVIKNEK